MTGKWDASGAALIFTLALLFISPAQSAELRILVSGAFKSAMADIKPLFEQPPEHKVTFDCRHLGPDRHAHRGRRTERFHRLDQ